MPAVGGPAVPAVGRPAVPAVGGPAVPAVGGREAGLLPLLAHGPSSPPSSRLLSRPGCSARARALADCPGGTLAVRDDTHTVEGEEAEGGEAATVQATRDKGLLDRCISHVRECELVHQQRGGLWTAHCGETRTRGRRHRQQRPSLTFPFLVLLTLLRLHANLLIPLLVLASNTPVAPIVLQLRLCPRVGLAPAVPLGSGSRVLFIRVVVAGPAARAAANAGSAPSRGPGPP